MVEKTQKPADSDAGKLLPDDIIDAVNRFKLDSAYGKIQINFAGGKVRNFSVEESFLVK